MPRQFVFDVPRLSVDIDLATAFYSFLRQTPGGEWAYHIDDEKLMGPPGSSSDPAAGHRLTLLARSWRSLLPEVIYRNLRVPMLLIDPTGDDTEPFSNVPDNQRLAAQQPSWIHHVQYPDTPHAAHPSRPEWFVRDMKLLRQWIEESGSNDCR